ncbi:MAG: hypothetical protein GY749_35090 [Desulfobacteraceae bacterium]|nr:hypothetical protein [Desulfobacteraceae bacterium]
MKYISTAERIGIEKGIMKKARETAENLLLMGVLTNEQIAQATGLTLKDIQDLQKTVKHGNS